MVIDGNCRDTPRTRTFAIPIYSRGYHPNAGTANKLGETAVDVEMGATPSVVVRHGDIVLGDDDGVVVASLAELEDWLPAAESIVATETEMLAQIQGGRSLLEMTTYHEHVAALRAGKESALGFTV